MRNSKLIETAVKLVNDSLSVYEHGAVMQSNVINIGLLQELEDRLLEAGCFYVEKRGVDGKLHSYLERPE
jgi:hypothetical protein